MRFFYSTVSHHTLNSLLNGGHEWFGGRGAFSQTPDKGILFEIFSGRILSRLAGGNSEKEPIEVL